jgi:septum formation protein
VGAPFIVLASASPRRRELLESCGIPFRVEVSDAPEAISADDLALGLPYVVTLLAGRKAEAVRRRVAADPDADPELAGGWFLGADTVVDVDGDLLGKPADEGEARRMLLRLSGREHRVHTGIALIPGPGAAADAVAVTTEVRFRPLSEEEVSWYLRSREWEGAAGAYRIQERAGLLVESIRGSYSNVVGLPLEAFYGILTRHHYRFGGI